MRAHAAVLRGHRRPRRFRRELIRLIREDGRQSFYRNSPWSTDTRVDKLIAEFRTPARALLAELQDRRNRLAVLDAMIEGDIELHVEPSN